MKKIRVSCLIKMGGGLVNPRSAFPTYTPVVPTSPYCPPHHRSWFGTINLVLELLLFL